jgi:dienelactone hydrolase
MFGTRLLLSVFACSVLPVTLWLGPSSAEEPLPNTKPLTDEGDLAAKMVAGMHKYLDRELAAAVEKRKEFWKPDGSSPENYAKSVEPNRERLRRMLGVVDKRLLPKLEYVGGPGTSSSWGIPGSGSVTRVRWAVLPGVDAEGLCLEPGKPYLADVIYVPHAGVPPEAVSGILPDSGRFAAQLAEQGCRVLIPTVIDRNDTHSANPKLNRATNLPHREFIYRMAYEMGRTLTGYEVQKVLAAADWLAGAQAVKRPLAVVGSGDGGAIALYAAALDPRFSACLVSGDFGSRGGDVSGQPIDRNAWGLLREFGDAELGMLVAPRKLLIDNSPTPTWDGPVAGQPGRGGAAPGKLEPIPQKVIDQEVDRLRTAAPLRWEPVIGIKTGEAVEKLLAALGKEKRDPQERIFEKVGQPFPTGDIPDRHQRQFDQLVSYTQKLWRDSDATRKEFWKKADAKSPEVWEKSCEWYRDYFHTEVIGKLPEPTIPLNPRTRQVYDEKTWTGYEVMLDVYPDVFAYGILLLPKDLKPGERRPVVVCQHGLEGTPRHTIDAEKRTVYNHFSRRLVEQGYVVYAPQNPYYGENTFRQLQRKANPLKLSLFSFIIRQHQRTLDWLETLPNVDPKRIAFYGLSYGGKTAMRVPAVEKRYCLSICSGDFNEWVGKNVSVDLDRSYMWTREYEMYEFDLGNTFNYAEMAYLIAPRPFMVERGHDDGVGTDEMVAYEYARVRYLYANRLKIGDRTEIEFFPGGHMINGKGTFAFLAKHLKWEPK